MNSVQNKVNYVIFATKSEIVVFKTIDFINSNYDLNNNLNRIYVESYENISYINNAFLLLVSFKTGEIVPIKFDNKLSP